MTTIGEIIEAKKSKGVFTISPSNTVAEALRLLARHNVGALVVVNDGQLVGIISERDIVRKAADVSPLDQKRVDEVMTRDLIVGVPQDRISYVMSIMTKSRIRHLPVMLGRRMVGLVSIGDVVKAQISESHHEIRMLRDYIDGRYPS